MSKKNNPNAKKFRIKLNTVVDTYDKIKQVGDDARQRAVESIMKILGHELPIAADIIENSIFNRYGGDADEYNNYIFEFCTNNDLLSHVNFGKNRQQTFNLNYEKIIKENLDSYVEDVKNLCPEQWKEIRTEYETEQNASKNYKIVGSTAYLCFKCKKRNAIPLVSQHRAGDEGQSFWVICGECNNKWII